MQFEDYLYPSRRSNVIAAHGLVATSQPLAAQAGIRILQDGGNAVDAAIAAIAVMCVTEPCSTGIGGDAFAFIWQEAEQQLYALNASGPAPQALTAAALRTMGHEKMPVLGPLSVTVPGSLRGWQLALDRFGSLTLDTLLQSAIDYARDGFPVSQRIARAWQSAEGKMSAYPDSQRVWLPQGRAPRAAELFGNPEFARTLEAIAHEGPDIFYHGSIGQQIADCIQETGGVLTMDDLADYEAEWVEPISSSFNEFAFHEIPPNSQGLTALLALNIAAEFDLAGFEYGSADYYHVLIEAVKLGFADAQAFIADPRQADVPVDALLQLPYTQHRKSLISMETALTPIAGRPLRHGDTVYLTVADGAGNMVSWIQSLYMGFGSGLTAGNTGIQLQNRGSNFSLVPGHPNEVAPGKRPYHTIIPGFITRNGRAWSSFGVMGGFMQPQGHLQVGLNLTQFGMDPQTALDAPRFNWLADKRVALEPAVPDDVRQELSRRGHQLLEKGADMHYGGGQVIVRDPDTRVLIAGSEPRKDGAAVGW